MARPPRRGRNEPDPPPVIVKKIVVEAHAGHHGGQWKVAYADFMTAMMAFFMLMWLLSVTDESTRRGIADYFTATQSRTNGGGDGLLKGDSLVAKDKLPQKAIRAGIIPTPAGDALDADDTSRLKDRARFVKLKRQLIDRMDRTPELERLKSHVRFMETPEGLRINLVDEADFSMFAIGTDKLQPQALDLVREVARVIATVPNEVIVRGHTDALRYAKGQTRNNWTLSTARAEATRAALESGGIAPLRFVRIEGVADREPFVPKDIYDARNRRMSITLAWTKGEGEAPAKS
jgi:chemotaxis protein MotB